MYAVKRLHARKTQTACATRTCKSDCELSVSYTKSVNCNSFNVFTETIRYKIIWKILTSISQ